MAMIIVGTIALAVVAFLGWIAYSTDNEEVRARCIVAAGAFGVAFLLTAGLMNYPKTVEFLITFLVLGVLVSGILIFIQLKFLDWWDGRMSEKLHRVVDKEHGLSTEMSELLHWEIDRIYGQLRQKRRL